MANTFPTAKTPQVNQQYEFSKRNPWKFSEKTSFSQRLLATTSSASPLKVKSKFLVWLGSKNRYRYGGISNEILNTGTGFFYLRNPRLQECRTQPNESLQIKPLPLTNNNPVPRIWNPRSEIKKLALCRVPYTGRHRHVNLFT